MPGASFSSYECISAEKDSAGFGSVPGTGVAVGEFSPNGVVLSRPGDIFQRRIRYVHRACGAPAAPTNKKFAPKLGTHPVASLGCLR